MTKRSALFSAVIAFAPTAAWAHPGHDTTAGFVSGLLHALTGMDHIVAMVLVGVWAALFAPRSSLAVVVPGAFVAAVLAGYMGSALYGAIPAEALILASLGVLGIAAAAGLRAPLPLAVGAAALFGFGHGLAHGTSTPDVAFPALFGAGLIVSTAALHGLGMVAARYLPVMLTRGAGAIAAATAIASTAAA